MGRPHSKADILAMIQGFAKVKAVGNGHRCGASATAGCSRLSIPPCEPSALKGSHVAAALQQALVLRI